MVSVRGELLNIRSGVAGEIAYLDANYQHISKSAIEAVKTKDRQILGDGNLAPHSMPIVTLSEGEIPPWIEPHE